MLIEKKDIRVLVIDDIDSNIGAVIQGLKNIGLSLENMFPLVRTEGQLLKFATAIKSLALDNKTSKIFKLLKEIIIKKKIDILFLDLNLTGDEDIGKTTGENIIELFANSDEMLLAHIPIVIISKHSEDEVREGLSKMLPILHIKKADTSFNREIFVESMEEKKLGVNIVQVVKNYREIRDSEEYQLDIKYIKNKLNNLNYSDKLDNIVSVLNNIDSKTLAADEKLKHIEIFNKAIIKTLPLLSQNKKVKKVLSTLEESDIKSLLGADFPEDLGATLYSKIQEIKDKGTDELTNSVIKGIIDEVKNHIAKEADFVEYDNLIEKTGKLTLYIINQIGAVASGDL